MIRLEVDMDTVDRLGDNLAEHVPVSGFARLEREASSILDTAQAGWPVRSGRSRAAFTLQRYSDGVGIRNTAPYAFAVQFSGGGNAWAALVERPARAGFADILAELAGDAARAAVEG